MFDPKKRKKLEQNTARVMRVFFREPPTSLNFVAEASDEQLQSLFNLLDALASLGSTIMNIETFHAFVFTMRELNISISDVLKFARESKDRGETCELDNDQFLKGLFQQFLRGTLVFVVPSDRDKSTCDGQCHRCNRHISELSEMTEEEHGWDWN
ncbi:MAG: hypothetical protein WCT24_01810 [Patescibacteria group bacterium]|jgi:hypothetical protein